MSKKIWVLYIFVGLLSPFATLLFIRLILFWANFIGLPHD